MTQGTHGFFTVVDLDLGLPEGGVKLFPPQHIRNEKQNKRTRSTSVSSTLEVSENDKSLQQANNDDEDEPPSSKNYTICLKYNDIMYMDFIQKDEMLVIEQPWLSVLDTLPNALERQVYGT